MESEDENLEDSEDDYDWVSDYIFTNKDLEEEEETICAHLKIFLKILNKEEDKNKFVGKARKHDKKSKFLNEEENKEDGEWETVRGQLPSMRFQKYFPVNGDQSYCCYLETEGDPIRLRQEAS